MTTSKRQLRSDDSQREFTKRMRARRRGPRPITTLREDISRDAVLGFGYLGIGGTVIGLLLCLRGVLIFALQFPTSSHSVSGVLAWILVFSALAVSFLATKRRSGRLSTPAFTITIGLLTAALLLDLVPAIGTMNALLDSTVFFGIGATLLTIVATRPVRQLLIADGALFAIMVVVMATSLHQPGFAPGPHIEVLVLSCSPALIGVAIVVGYEHLVKRELDMTLVESTVGNPRYAFGIHASDELARLDLSAEQLLQEVASGRATLPLSPELAAEASSLATELRLILLAGRNETWLQHAIRESDALGPVVTCKDPDGLAGYLDQGQREGLLSAIWLLVGDTPRVHPQVGITIGPAVDQPAVQLPARIEFPIELDIDGITPRRYDPAFWSEFSRVGTQAEFVARGTLKITAVVETTAHDIAFSSELKETR
jgi:hypothetical protein